MGGVVNDEISVTLHRRRGTRVRCISRPQRRRRLRDDVVIADRHVPISRKLECAI